MCSPSAAEQSVGDSGGWDDRQCTQSFQKSLIKEYALMYILAMHLCSVLPDKCQQQILGVIEGLFGRNSEEALFRATVQIESMQT